MAKTRLKTFSSLRFTFVKRKDLLAVRLEVVVPIALLLGLLSILVTG